MNRPLAWLVSLALLALGAWLVQRRPAPERVAQSSERSEQRAPDPSERALESTDLDARTPAVPVERGSERESGAGEVEPLAEMPEREYFIVGTLIGPYESPIRGARVGVLHHADPDSWPKDAISDEHGRFRIGPVPDGIYELGVDAHEAKLVHGEITKVRAGAFPFVLHLRQYGKLRGRVVDATTGRPCVAAVRVNSPMLGGSYYTRTTSAEDGTFALDALEPGDYPLVAYTEDARWAFVRLRVDLASEIPAVELPVQPGARVRVRDTSDVKGEGTDTCAKVRWQGVWLGFEVTSWLCTVTPRRDRWLEFVTPVGQLLVVAKPSSHGELAIDLETCPSLEFSAAAGMQYDLEILHEDDLVLHLTGSRAFE